jgi:hypothetical protein
MTLSRPDLLQHESFREKCRFLERFVRKAAIPRQTSCGDYEAEKQLHQVSYAQDLFEGRRTENTRVDVPDLLQFSESLDDLDNRPPRRREIRGSFLAQRRPGSRGNRESRNIVLQRS